MKKSTFSEEQIVAILKEQEAGVKTADVCRRHGISSAIFFKWKTKYGGLEVSDAKPHSALGNITPMEFAQQIRLAEMAA